MNNKISILDCTIRDGGYYVAWDFDNEMIKSYLNFINDSIIDFIEIGYRSPVKTDYFGQYYYTSKATLDMVREHAPDKKIAIMLNGRECLDLDLDQLLYGCHQRVDLIRIAADPAQLEENIELARKIKDMGFAVAINIMYLSKIHDNLEIIEKLASIDFIDRLNIVDSFGAATPQMVSRFICSLVKKTDVPLGFHGHNNIELAFANSLAALEAGASSIDSTILGMGRGAGNLKTELLLVWLSKQGFDVNINALGQIVNQLSLLHEKHKWGPSFPYVISGVYNFPQKEVMQMMVKKRYAFERIVRKLNAVVHQENHAKEWPELVASKFRACQPKQVLIVGGGQTVKDHLAALNLLVANTDDLIVIHSSARNIEVGPVLAGKTLMCLTGSEATKLSCFNSDGYLICPNSNDFEAEIGDKLLQTQAVGFAADYADAPLALALQAALDLGAQQILLAGFDGYLVQDEKEQILAVETQQVIDKFLQLDVPLASLTETLYTNVATKSVYSILNQKGL